MYFLSGETPLDIAFKLNNSNLVRIFAQLEWNEEKFSAASRSANLRKSIQAQAPPLRKWSSALTNAVPVDVLNMIVPGEQLDLQQYWENSPPKLTLQSKPTSSMVRRATLPCV